MGKETFDQVVSVTTLDEDGEIRTRTRDEIVADYRNVPSLRRNFALQAVFQGESDHAESIKERWDASRAKRRATQPVAASAGCVFKNPEVIPAGKLVDELGLKGSSFGKAAVSDMHGNFIVNKGGAPAGDVIGLIERIRAEARTSRGVELDTEVKILGEDEFTF